MNKLKSQFKIGTDGISAWNKEQISAKANALNLTDSLTNEALAMAKDATFTDRAKTKKLKWIDAIEDEKNSTDDLLQLMQKQNLISDKYFNYYSGISGSKEKRNALKSYIEDSESLKDSIIDIGELTEESKSKFTSFGDSVKGAFATITSSTLGITALIVGGMMAFTAIMDQFDDLSYNEANSKFSTSSSDYESAKAEVESTKQQLDEVNAKIKEINSNPLTLSSEAELSKLKAQREELNGILEMKESIADADADKAAADAYTASKAKTNMGTAMKSSGKWYDELNTTLSGYIAGDSLIAKTLRNFVPGFQQLADTYNSFTDSDVVKGNYASIEKLGKEQKEIEEWFNKNQNSDPNSKKFKQKQERYAEIATTIADLNSEIAEKRANIESQLSAMQDENGNPRNKAYSKRIAELKDDLNEIDHLENSNMTKQEKIYNSIDKYFNKSSSSGLKSYLQNLAQQGKLTEQSLRELGITAKDIGIDEGNFGDVIRYFKDLTTAADDAKKSVQDYATSVTDVKTATDSVNQDSDWSTIQSAYKSAKELLTEGKTGTDDFQSVASFLNPKKVKEYAEQGGKYTADAYQKAFEEVKATADRWFGDDETTSMENFVNDFKDKGLWNVSTDDMGLWDIQKNFKSTAEAADKFGISVNAVETMLRGLEAYGYDFGDVMFSGEKITEYKSTLDNIKTIYDSMEDSAEKTRLGKLIENWDAEYQKYSDDLSTLTSDEPIVKIKFEYDLASIQQQIDQLDSQWANGDHSASVGASRITYKEQKRKMLEEKTGYKDAGDDAYNAIDDKINTIREKLKSTTDKDEIAVLQDKRAAYEDMLSAFNQFRLDGNDINWEDYLKTNEAKKAFDEIQKDGSLSVEQLNDLFGTEIKVPVKLDLDMSKSPTKILEEINKLASGESVTYKANVDGDINTDVTALKNEDGTITYTANIDGAEKTLATIRDQKGNIKYTAEFDGTENWIKENLENEQTLIFNADVNGVIKQVRAVKDQDGNITYYSSMDDGSSKKVEEKTDQDGKITFTTDTSEVEKSAEKAKKTAENIKPTVEFKAKFAGFDTKEVEEEMKNWSKKGSVDLNNRPQVKASTLADMGYKDTGNPNDTATVFSSSFSSEDGKKTVVVTPILPDGDVLEPGALEEYANEMLNGGSDSQGIEIRTYYGDDSIEKSNRYAEALHEVQQAYYLGNDAQKQALNSLSQYTDAQLKSINLSDDQSSAMEDSMTSLMDSLGIGKESLSEFVDVLSDMGLVQIDVEDNATDKIADIVSELTGIPKEQLTDIIANDNASPDVLNVLATLSGIPKEKLTEINASDGASGVITYVLSQILGIPESEVTNLIATDSVSNICSSATNAIDNVPDSKNTSLDATDNASSKANSASSAVKGIPTSWFVTIGGGLSAAFTSAVAAAKNALASLGGGGHNLYGTAHLGGTLGGTHPIPNLSARALAMGTLQDDSFLRDSWKTAKTEVALTGEKGPEIVIPPNSNRWYTVGDQGAEFAAIPAGSTVFNSKQSKELLTKGKTNSRAKGNPSLPGLPSSMAFLQGTAHRLGTPNNSGASSGSSGSSPGTSSSNTNTSNTNSDTSSTEKATENLVDWIKVFYDRVSRLADLAEKAIDRAVGLINKQAAATDAINKVQNELSAAQQAANKYLEYANQVDLSDDYKRKIQNGELSIEDITDENVKDAVSKYQERYRFYAVIKSI